MDCIYLYNNGIKKLLCNTASKDHVMLYHKLSMKLGEAGSMQVKLLLSDSLLSEIKPMSSEISFERNGVELFRGEPVMPEAPGDFSEIININGALSYFGRVLVHPYEYSGSVYNYLVMIVNEYNAKVDLHHRITLGIVEVEDPNSYIVRSDTDYCYALDLMMNKLVDHLGGYFRVRVVNGKKYLDYVYDTGVNATQSVEYGKNLISSAQSVDYQEVYSVVVPLGAQDETTGLRLTVEDVNNDSPYVADENALEKYGRREKAVYFDDVTLASNLLTKGRAELAKLTSPIRSVTIKAIDESVYKDGVDAWYLGDTVSCPVPINNNGVVGYETISMMLTERDIYALNPEKELLEFGTVKQTFSTMVSKQINGLREESEKLKRDNLNLAQKIQEAEGMYSTIVDGSDGKKIFYLHDMQNLNDSYLQISFSDAGVLVSSDRGTHWYGLTINGDVLANIIKAHGIEAGSIIGGYLTSSAGGSDDMPVTWVNMNTGEFSLGDGSISYKNGNLYISSIQTVNKAISDLSSDVNYLQNEFDYVYSAIDAAVDGVTEAYGADDELIRGDIASQGTEIMSNCEQIVMSALAEYVEKGDLESFKTTVASQFSQTANAIDLRFLEVKEKTDSIDGLTETENAIKKHFEFTAAGLKIKSGEGQMELLLDNDKIRFTRNGEEFGFWDGVDFHTGNIVVDVNERAQFGSFAFVPRSDGSLSFLKVGD